MRLLVSFYLVIGVIFMSLSSSLAGENFTGFDRMMKDGKIRCGYQYWDGGIYKDEKTGELAGFFVDYTNKMAESLEIDVEWVGPIEWSNIAAELKTNKIDAWCATSWLSARNSKYMLVSEEVAYSGFEAFVRANDTRFDDDPESLNKSSVIMATLENTSSDTIAKGILPKATPYPLPSLVATDMELLVNVASGKADVAFTSPGVVYQYMEKNPNKVKRLYPGNPYAMMGFTYTVGDSDYRLLHSINTGIRELKNTGFTKRLIEKYNEKYPELFIEE